MFEETQDWDERLSVARIWHAQRAWVSGSRVCFSVLALRTTWRRLLLLLLPPLAVTSTATSARAAATASAVVTDTKTFDTRHLVGGGGSPLKFATAATAYFCYCFCFNCSDDEYYYGCHGHYHCHDQCHSTYCYCCCCIQSILPMSALLQLPLYYHNAFTMPWQCCNVPIHHIRLSSYTALLACDFRMHYRLDRYLGEV